MVQYKGTDENLNSWAPVYQTGALTNWAMAPASEGLNLHYIEYLLTQHSYKETSPPLLHTTTAHGYIKLLMYHCLRNFGT
jgi:hypothetical protein